MEHALENGGGLAAWRNGELCAYTLYAVQEKKVICPETVFAHPLDLLALLRALASRFDGAETIEFSTPVTDTVRYMLKDGRARAYIEPFDMFRIVDFAALLQTFKYPVTINGEWVIEIQDAQAPWNAGRWRIQVYEGRAKVSRTDATADFSCGIGDMVPILSGLVLPETMARCRRLYYRDHSKLVQFGAVFPALTAYLFEMY